MDETTQTPTVSSGDAAVSVTVNGALINPGDQKSNIAVRATLDHTSVVAIAVAEYEKICKREIEYLQGELGDGQAALKSLEDELKEKLQEIVEGLIADDVEEAHAFYRKHGLAFRHEAPWVRDGLKLKYSLKFFSSQESNSYSSTQRNAVESTPRTVTLTQADVKELLKQIRDQSSVNTRLMTKLSTAKSRLQDLPAFKRTAEARIAKVILGDSPEYAKLAEAMSQMAVEEYGVLEFRPKTEVVGAAAATSKSRKKKAS